MSLEQCTSQELMTMMGEISQLESTGVLPDGVVRRMTTEACTRGGASFPIQLIGTVHEVLREAAMRWHAWQMYHQVVDGAIRQVDPEPRYHDTEPPGV